MGSKAGIKLLLMGIFLISIILLGFILYESQEKNAFTSNLALISYESCQSTDPANPKNLTLFSIESETYPSLNNYYYRTNESVNTSFYQVIWVKPEGGADCDLFLYSDSLYSVLNSTSSKTGDALDWVVIRPNVSQNLYPLVNTSNTSSSAQIAWKDNHYIFSPMHSWGAPLINNNYMDVYGIFLSKSSIYNITLTVPSGGDFDLYFYHLDSGMSMNSSEYLLKSTNVGNDTDEQITHFHPQHDDLYAVLIERVNGSGSYQLSAAEVILNNNVSVWDSYNTSLASIYFYQTEEVYDFRPNVLWLQPTSPSDNFDLFLYSDSGYSSLMGYSARSSGALEWIIFSPNSTTKVYPQVEALSTGSAYIEMQEGLSSLELGSSKTGSLSATNCIEIYYIYLSESSGYDFILEVPNGADFDLYLYSISSGVAANSSEYINRSTIVGNGLDEVIPLFIPSSSGFYSIIITRSNGSGPFTFSASSNTLNADSSICEYYNNLTAEFYYYQTNTASHNYFHVVWVQPNSTTDNFDLALYSDSAYSTSMASSKRPKGELDWIVFRPELSQTVYYPQVQALSAGYAYLEWDVANNFLFGGDNDTEFLNASDCIEIYTAYLYNSSAYDINLIVPNDGDFDLYLYYLGYGDALNYSNYVISLATTGKGIDESLSIYNPPDHGYYALLVVRSSGSGNYTLQLEYYQPKILNESEVRYDYYFGLTSYYYKTRNYASSYSPHVVWISPISNYNNFELFLYSDPGYSSLICTSFRPVGELDWVVFSPGTYQYFYPKVHSTFGSEGYAYIEWERGSTLSILEDPSGVLNSSNCIDIYNLFLLPFSRYQITLEVPDEGDFDLYLYQLDRGTANNSEGAILRSITSEMGTNEIISNYKPTGYYDHALLVVRSSGTGIYTLHIDYFKGIPSFEFIPVILGICIIIITFRYLGLGKKILFQK